MMIRAVGAASLIATHASIPERFGIRTSIKITSGTAVAASSVAAMPSPASPTTSMSSSTPRSMVRPRRKSSWSSTTATRIGSPPRAPASTVSATASRVCRRCWSSSWSVILVMAKFLSKPVQGSAVVRPHRAFGAIEDPRHLNELEIFVVVEDDDGASFPGQALDQRPGFVDLWNGSNRFRRPGKRGASSANVPPLPVLGEVHHAASQVRQMVLDGVPAWLGRREHGLHEVLAQVTRTTHKERQPDQRQAVRAVGRLKARSSVVIATHDLYVVREGANVASGQVASPNSPHPKRACSASAPPNLLPADKARKGLLMTGPDDQSTPRNHAPQPNSP